MEDRKLSSGSFSLSVVLQVLPHLNHQKSVSVNKSKTLFKVIFTLRFIGVTTAASGVTRLCGGGRGCSRTQTTPWQREQRNGSDDPFHCNFIDIYVNIYFLINIMRQNAASTLCTVAAPVGLVFSGLCTSPRWCWRGPRRITSSGKNLKVDFPAKAEV